MTLADLHDLEDYLFAIGEREAAHMARAERMARMYAGATT